MAFEDIEKLKEKLGDDIGGLLGGALGGSKATQDDAALADPETTESAPTDETSPQTDEAPTKQPSVEDQLKEEVKNKLKGFF